MGLHFKTIKLTRRQKTKTRIWNFLSVFYRRKRTQINRNLKNLLKSFDRSQSNIHVILAGWKTQKAAALGVRKKWSTRKLTNTWKLICTLFTWSRERKRKDDLATVRDRNTRRNSCWITGDRDSRNGFAGKIVARSKWVQVKKLINSKSWRNLLEKILRARKVQEERQGESRRFCLLLK